MIGFYHPNSWEAKDWDQVLPDVSGELSWMSAARRWWFWVERFSSQVVILSMRFGGGWVKCGIFGCRIWIELGFLTKRMWIFSGGYFNWGSNKNPHEASSLKQHQGINFFPQVCFLVQRGYRRRFILTVSANFPSPKPICHLTFGVRSLSNQVLSNQNKGHQRVPGP